MADTDRDGNSTGRCRSYMPMTPPPNMKRAASNESETPATKKHRGSSVAFDHSSQLLHVRASGEQIHPALLFTEDDELVRNVRQQDAMVVTDDEDAAPAPDADEYDYLNDESDASVYEDAAAELASDAEGQEVFHARRGDGDTSLEEEDDDLFGKFFGKSKAQVKVEEAAEEDSDLEIIDTQPHRPASTDKPAQRTTDHYSHHDPTEHVPGCTHTTRSASTPPPPSSIPALKPLVKKRPEQSDLVKDVRRSLTQQRKLHDKAKQFQPRLALGSHRYWICVLHAGRRVSTINSEKHFTWLKGNRLSTIATISHHHATATLTEDFVLLLGHERVDLKDTCEELDYFGDQFVCLRAVAGKDLQAKGRELGEGCPPEVIEIDLE
ncbi:hypothetical protein LTR91_000989 [Friedmanniomyces endolithicus]|uniref:Uncharacterized protein n=1 Tax=Friedmanniomyces endolithicus TaxID=329885 RepID=A0A4U0V407_9PEZI|nr:hypothetical protein LTS09_009814 [Friedmanniomyces endolithicus]KAK0271098.1 hypothetical protein LTR35_013659 [Friedmanniomyces endolithicus]KAK0277635.1 hypothetical protein LTS00_014126 [Friedmanniomyces endolithicus]KAK0307462.1 hypothetical protein LTR01_005462 [Friedmanniomyces endolithicus]KAK0314335.1 hypothetical protein LTR82_013052 [Friedmanniomyces endolithicus]